MRSVRWQFVVLVVAVSCGPSAPGTLSLSASPKMISGAQKAVITIDAREAGDRVGVGSIAVSAPSGELDPMSATLDAFGSAQVNFTCARCGTETVTVTARWVSNGGAVTGTVRIPVMGDGSGATGGGSTAGGAAGGATAGGVAGGSTAGGVAGGSTAGGVAGGSAGGMAGGSTSGGSAGGATAGGSAGGATAGGTSGGLPIGGGCVATLSGPTSGDVPCAFTAAINPNDGGTTPFTMQIVRGNGGPQTLNIAMNALPVDVAVRSYQWPDVSTRGAELRVDEQVTPGVLRSWSANVFRNKPPPSFSLDVTSLDFVGIDLVPRDAGFRRYTPHGTLDTVLPYENGPTDAGMGTLTVHIVF